MPKKTATIKKAKSPGPKPVRVRVVRRTIKKKAAKALKRLAKNRQLRTVPVRLASLFLLFGCMSYLSGYAMPGSQAYFTVSATIETNSVTAGDWSVPPVETPGIVLNEFLPNPHGEVFGSNSDSKPKGEWVELYNPGDQELSLAGYSLRDSNDEHRIFIEGCRTLGGITIIPAHGYLVVFRKGEDCGPSNFQMNNNRDTVRLYDATDSLIDSYSYDAPYCDLLEPTPGKANGTADDKNCTQTVPENKSFARIPDGSSNWVDPVPTPGGPNKLEETPEPPVVEDPTEKVMPAATGEPTVPSEEGKKEPAAETPAPEEPAIETETPKSPEPAAEPQPVIAEEQPEAEPAIVEEEPAPVPTVETAPPPPAADETIITEPNVTE